MARFGSIALFLFLYAGVHGNPAHIQLRSTQEYRYNSLTSCMKSTAGSGCALHHWGASMMIVVVVIHMTQVFSCLGLQKPRETTWIVGVILLLLTLSFGLTGYLLPWDNTL